MMLNVNQRFEGSMSVAYRVLGVVEAEYANSCQPQERLASAEQSRGLLLLACVRY